MRNHAIPACQKVLSLSLGLGGMLNVFCVSALAESEADDAVQALLEAEGYFGGSMVQNALTLPQEDKQRSIQPLRPARDATPQFSTPQLSALQLSSVSTSPPLSCVLENPSHADSPPTKQQSQTRQHLPQKNLPQKNKSLSQRPLSISRLSDAHSRLSVADVHRVSMAWTTCQKVTAVDWLDALPVMPEPTEAGLEPSTLPKSEVASLTPKAPIATTPTPIALEVAPSVDEVPTAETSEITTQATELHTAVAEPTVLADSTVEPSVVQESVAQESVAQELIVVEEAIVESPVAEASIVNPDSADALSPEALPGAVLEDRTPEDSAPEDRAFEELRSMESEGDSDGADVDESDEDDHEEEQP